MSIILQRVCGVLYNINYQLAASANSEIFAVLMKIFIRHTTGIMVAHTTEKKKLN